MAKLTKEELNFLREKFVKSYSKKKGWNHNELTLNQLLEITKQNDYKSPSLKNHFKS